MKGASARAANGRCLDHSAFQRKANPLSRVESADDFAREIADFCLELNSGTAPGAVAIATAGEVNSAGSHYLCAGEHLGVMRDSAWIERLIGLLSCPVVLINDAEAYLLGVSESGALPCMGNIGAFVVGTGLGFVMVRDGRWWKPARRLLHVGAIETPEGGMDRLVSAVRATEGGVFQGGDSPERERYLDNLTGVVASIVHLMVLDHVFLGGGLTDAAKAAGMDLAGEIAKRLRGRLLPGFSVPKLSAPSGGNAFILRGALALAAGLQETEPARYRGDFGNLATESACEGLPLEKWSAEAIAARLAAEENAAADRFCGSAAALGQGAEWIAEALRSGGRVIYLGAGTSGRLGALDAVEMPCTYGLRRDQFVAVIAGGVADACLSIESDFEEDDFSIRELLVLQPSSRDVVIGISASGTAFFVRSGLAFAKARGARTIFLHEAELQDEPWVDLSIRLQSGPELIRGSTRMKSGTATKKALNILSTTSMILLGKVRSGEMIDLHCTNAKLKDRAERILSVLHGTSREESRKLLQRHRYHLRSALLGEDAGSAFHHPSPASKPHPPH